MKSLRSFCLAIAVACVLGGGASKASAQVVVTEPLITNDERVVVIDGVRNARDFGYLPAKSGYYIKPGLLFRTANLCSVTSKGKNTMRKLGWRTTIDLRSQGELEVTCMDQVPNSLFDKMKGTVCHRQFCPMDIKRNEVNDYESYLLDNSEAIRGFFEILADEKNYPLDFHCAAGKDRTGILGALTLELLGTPRPVIFLDFLYSRHCDMPVEAKNLQLCFDIIDQKYQGIANYLQAMGVKPEEMERIPKILLESKDIAQKRLAAKNSGR